MWPKEFLNVTIPKVMATCVFSIYYFIGVYWGQNYRVDLYATYTNDNFFPTKFMQFMQALRTYCRTRWVFFALVCY